MSLSNKGVILSLLFILVMKMSLMMIVFFFFFLYGFLAGEFLGGQILGPFFFFSTVSHPKFLFVVPLLPFRCFSFLFLSFSFFLLGRHECKGTDEWDDEHRQKICQEPIIPREGGI